MYHLPVLRGGKASASALALVHTCLLAEIGTVVGALEELLAASVPGGPAATGAAPLTSFPGLFPHPFPPAIEVQLGSAPATQSVIGGEVVASSFVLYKPLG